MQSGKLLKLSPPSFLSLGVFTQYFIVKAQYCYSIYYLYLDNFKILLAFQVSEVSNFVFILAFPFLKALSFRPNSMGLFPRLLDYYLLKG